jgi:hypothetical protein
VDPGDGLDDMEKRKFLTLPGFELRPLGHYTDYAIKGQGGDKLILYHNIVANGK